MAADMLIEVQRMAVAKGWRLSECNIDRVLALQVLSVGGVPVFQVEVTDHGNGRAEVEGTWFGEIPDKP